MPLLVESGEQRVVSESERFVRSGMGHDRATDLFQFAELHGRAKPFHTFGVLATGNACEHLNRESFVSHIRCYSTFA